MPTTLGTYSHGHCSACGKAFTTGGAILSEAGDVLASLCMWCIAIWESEITGFKFDEQLLDWHLKKNLRRHNRGRAWRKTWEPDVPL